MFKSLTLITQNIWCRRNSDIGQNEWNKDRCLERESHTRWLMVAKSDKKNVSKYNKSCGNQYSVKEATFMRLRFTSNNNVPWNAAVLEKSSHFRFLHTWRSPFYSTRSKQTQYWRQTEQIQGPQEVTASDVEKVIRKKRQNLLFPHSYSSEPQKGRYWSMEKYN